MTTDFGIVLIGMPGCGKTTVGRALAQRLGREFVDLDEAITEKAGRTPGVIIRAEGEEAFRRIETEVLSAVSARKGIVLATGGGTVTIPQNIPYLRQIGRIVFLDRPIDEISPTADRPLSQDRAALVALYEKRLPIYENSCDIKVKCGKTVEETVHRIKEMLR